MLVHCTAGYDVILDIKHCRLSFWVRVNEVSSVAKLLSVDVRNFICPSIIDRLRRWIRRGGIFYCLQSLCADLSGLEFIDVILQQLTQREACLNTAIFTISVTDYKVIDSSSSP